MTTPAFLRTPDSNFDNLEGFAFEPHYVEIDGLRMHYVDEGPREAPVILMMHGMPTWSYLYRDIIGMMSGAGYRCIAPDHIGFGRSDKVTDPAWYNIARHTANARRLIETLDLTDITVMVQDWGGPTGLAQVCAMPDRFSRLVIMNTWLHHDAYVYTPAIQQWIRQWSPPDGILVGNIPDRFTLGGLMAMATSRVTPQNSLGPALRGGTPEYGPDALATKRAYDAPFAGMPDEAHAGPRRFPLSIPHHDPVSGDAANQARNFEMLNTTSLPVHFMWGVEDEVFTTDWGRQWASQVGNSTFEEITGARHFLQDTHGVEIARRLLAHMT